MIKNSFLRRAGLPLLGLTAWVMCAAPGNAAAIYGGNTTVTLNSATVGALTGLGFSIAPIAPASVTGLSAVFPITGGDTTTDITHSGGLAFTKGGVTTDISDFTINLTNNTLTGDVNGASGSSTPFFDIGAGAVLTLDPTLAGALSSIYGIPNLSGATIGTATINAVTTPEPASFVFVGLGLLAAGATARLRKPSTNA
jgi:hypothetical protein